MQARCINLDWLEVHAMEPATDPRDADYFRRCGFIVHERDYGTRIYHSMFTLEGADGQPLLEVRRNPKSMLHSPYECHVRLHNRTCYFDDAAVTLDNFLRVHGYDFARISRVDICLDFECFDSGDDPQRFLRRYISGKYSKINQSRVSAHGADTWSSRAWNSVSWGSPTSDIGTKLYNKTMELYDPTTKSYKKPYIRQAWLAAGLVDDMMNVTRHDADGNVYTPQIWRLEFSIRSSVKKWFVIELNGKQGAYQSIHNTLDVYSSRERILTVFASLCQHYFHFKHFNAGQRKDRCPDKQLFDWSSLPLSYRLDKMKPASADKPSKSIFILISRIRMYRDSKFDHEVRAACNVILDALENDRIRYDLNAPFTRAELQALQLVMAARSRGDARDAAVLLREIKELLRLNDKTIIF